MDKDKKCKNAKDDFEVDYYKLMNNLMFYKTTENFQEQRNIMLVHNH